MKKDIQVHCLWVFFYFKISVLYHLSQSILFSVPVDLSLVSECSLFIKFSICFPIEYSLEKETVHLISRKKKKKTLKTHKNLVELFKI